MIGAVSGYSRRIMMLIIGLGPLMAAVTGCVPTTRSGDPTTSANTAFPSIKTDEVCQSLVGFLQKDWVGTREGVTTYDEDAFASTRVFGMSPPQASCTYISSRTNLGAEPPNEEPYYISLEVIQGPATKPPKPGWKSRSLLIGNTPVSMSWEGNSAHDWSKAAVLDFSAENSGWSGNLNLPTPRGWDAARGAPISESDVHAAAQQLLATVRMVSGAR